MNDIVIRNRKVGDGHRPMIVAEMSGNHNQSLQKALQIVEAAAKAGAHALKLQTYTADTMTLDINEREFRIDDPHSLWHGYSLYQLYKEAHTPWEWHRPIFEHCRKHDLICFSAPFDATAVDFLEELDAPAYKIASFENTDIPLIQRVARTGKPVIISTGMATVAELDESVRSAREAGCEQLMLLKCTSSYPALPENANLRMIPHLRDLFGLQVGLSDHTLGIGTAVAGVAMGATLVEKHFILSRDEGGVDAAFSLEPGEFRTLVDETERAWQSLGSIIYDRSESEMSSLKYRRSLYVVEDMREGETFTDSNLRAIRPGLGLPLKYYEHLLGKRVNRDLKKGTPVSWDDIG